MARILMASIPAYGLANPSFPFARALVARGHQVDYLTHESFRDKVEHCGATLIPFSGGLSGPLVEARQLLRGGHRLFPEMNALVRRLARGYDAILACGINPGIPALERAVDRPVVFLSPVFFQNQRTIAHLASIATGLPAAARTAMSRPVVRRALTGLLGPLVLGTRRRDILELLAPQSSVLNITPASRYYQPYAEDFTERCLFAGPTATLGVPDPTFPLERLAAHDGPVIYATLGTVFNGWTRYFRTIADAFADTDALVVITTGHPAGVREVGPVAPNVVLRPFVPQTDVLAHADLCFTHGGFGSATDTVVMGVPAILTPMGADQFFNAYRMAELDAGRVLPRGEVTVDAVRRAAREALASGPGQGLQRLRQSFLSSPGPDGAAVAIEAIL